VTAPAAAPPSWRTWIAAAALAAWALASPASTPVVPLHAQEHAAPATATAAPATPVAGEDQAPHEGEAQAHAAEGREGEAHEAGSPWALIGKIFNFALLAGSLVYLLRSPAAAYLANRATTIRADLANAAETQAGAARQLAEIEARMKALPGEVEAMLERGKREVAAEGVRIREAAAAERERMLEQARREIELQVRAAERMLRRRAGELAVDVAAGRVKRAIGADDHARLVDRYLDQVTAGA